MFGLALFSAVLAAFCNGGAVVLQKMGADKHAHATKLRAHTFLNLLKDWPYLAGTALDTTAWLLTLIAVHSLPLFVVQPITSFSVVVAVLIERMFFKHQIPRRILLAMGIVIFGLILLAAAGSPETAAPVSPLIHSIVIAAPAVLALVGGLFLRNRHHYATAALAAISGLCFGGTAVVGRMMQFGLFDWRTLLSPLFIAMLAYGAVGIALFITALQRHRASAVNAVMITFETLGPVTIGLVFLGDSTRPGWGPVAVLGAITALVGAGLIAHFSHRQHAKTSQQEPAVEIAAT